MESCVGCLGRRSYEEALIHFFPALDKTAKRRRPNERVGDRIKHFLEDEEDLVSAVGLGYIFKGCIFEGIGFPEAIYKFGRTSIAHEGELDHRLSISEAGPWHIGRTWHLPASYIAGLVVSVIVAPENSNERIGEPFAVHFLGSTFQVDELWGREQMVRQLIEKDFRSLRE